MEITVDESLSDFKSNIEREDIFISKIDYYLIEITSKMLEIISTLNEHSLDISKIKEKIAIKEK